MIVIDGSYGEGGGQILRTAIALSCVTGETVRIHSIRANRPKPGLAAQHLKGIETAKLITGAQVEGLRMGSTEVTFRPGRIRGGKYSIDIGTAGSVTLLLQTVLLPLVVADRESTLEIKGGTDVAWSPPVDYFRKVTLRALEALGVRCRFELLRRGYYPKGGGVVKLDISPSELKGRRFERVHEDVSGVSHCQNLPAHVAERQARAAEEYLAERGLRANIEVQVLRGYSTGSGIVLWSGYKGGSALGERGKRAEIVGREAAENIYSELQHPSSFDYHLADQIMPFSAVATGRTEYTTSKITEHQISNAYVINKFFEDAVYLDRKNNLIRIN